MTVLLFQVELLHGLVYQTLEYISEKNRRFTASPTSRRSLSFTTDASLIPQTQQTDGRGSAEGRRWSQHGP